MARYRNIQMTFWTDSKIADEFSPEDKYFYLYLLTNPLTTLTGCYEVSKKQMSIDTGYTKETINKLLDRLDKLHQVIKYSPETKEVLILNWGKYNWTSSPKLRNSVSEQIKFIKDLQFREYVEGKFNGDTVSIPYLYGSDTSDCFVSDSLVSDSLVSVPEESKIDLAEENFQKLWELYPKKKGKSSISKATKKNLLKIGYEVMAKCIELYKQDIVGVEEQYVCFGSTFFNTRYKDYLEAATKSLELPPKKEEPEDEELSDEEFARLVESGAYDY